MTVKRNSALGFIFVTVLVDVIGFGIIIPVMPKLIEHLTGKGLSEAAQYGGWLLFAFAITQFFCSPIVGGLSDRYGRRPVLLLALLGFGLDYLFQAFAPTIGWLFVGRIIAGATGASFTTATAYIADVSPPGKKSAELWTGRCCLWPGLYYRAGYWRTFRPLGTTRAFCGGCRAYVHEFVVRLLHTP